MAVVEATSAEDVVAGAEAVGRASAVSPAGKPCAAVGWLKLHQSARKAPVRAKEELYGHEIAYYFQKTPERTRPPGKTT